MLLTQSFERLINWAIYYKADTDGCWGHQGESQQLKHEQPACGFRLNQWVREKQLPLPIPPVFQIHHKSSLFQDACPPALEMQGVWSLRDADAPYDSAIGLN